MPKVSTMVLPVDETAFVFFGDFRKSYKFKNLCKCKCKYMDSFPNIVESTYVSILHPMSADTFNIQFFS